MIEQLTEREQDVLDLMVDGLSNRAISQKLAISIDTVRWYNKQIYAKLDVHNRDDAIERATVLGLIGDDSTALNPDLPNNIPAQMTPFIGRETEIHQLLIEINNPHLRQITILAAGGMGKTRLSIEIANRLLNPTRTSELLFKNGVFLIELASVNNVDAIYSAIAEATGYELTDRDDLQTQIIKYLSNKHMLLIFDNFEHLLEDAEIISKILQSAPDVKILVTSRERLNLHGESIYTLRGMMVDNEVPVDSDGIKLFIDHAQRIRKDITLNAENLNYIRQICKLVSGMPLAIVLAAAWVDVLLLSEIPDEISNGIDFLRVEKRNVPERHTSIRAVFDPTWKRLTKHEKSVFMKLAIFRGGFTRDAAKAITEANIHTLQILLSRALIQLMPNGRYNLHELLRQYALEHLSSSGEGDRVYELHSLYYMKFLANHEADIKGARQIEALNEIETDFDNIGVAWRWAFEKGHEEQIHAALETVNWYNFMRFDPRLKSMMRWNGKHVTGLSKWLVDRLKLRHVRTRLPFDPLEESEQIVEQIMPVAIERADSFEIAYCHGILGSIARRAGNFEDAIAHYNQALEIYQQLDDQFYIATTLLGLARSYALTDTPDKIVVETIERAAAIAKAHGNITGYGTALREMAVIAWWKIGDVRKAQKYYLESIEIQRENGHQAGIAVSSASAAITMIVEGQTDLAQSYLTESLRLAEQYDVFDASAIALVGFATTDMIHQKYSSAQQKLEEAIQLVQHPLTYAFINLTSASLMCCLSEFRSAERYLLKYAGMFSQNMWWNPLFHIPTIIIIAAIENERDNHLKAAELLALIDTQEILFGIPVPFYEQLNVDLRNSLNDDDYQAAWKRRQSLDLQQVVRDFVSSAKNNHQET